MQGQLLERTSQISDHALHVHNELIELHRALQIAERENKRHEQAFEAHRQQSEELLLESERKIQLARNETALLIQENMKSESRMQRENANMAAQLSDAKSCAAAYVAQTRIALGSFSIAVDQLSREFNSALASERSARKAEAERMQALMDEAEASIAQKDAEIEEIERLKEELSSKLYSCQLRLKEADQKAMILGEDKVRLSGQVAEHTNTIQDLQLAIQEREREQRETKEKLLETMRSEMETRADLASERRMLEVERLRSKGAEALVEELKAQAQVQATLMAELRQQLAVCKAGLQRATQEEALCRESLEESLARLADSEAKHRRSAADLAAAAAAASAMHRAVCRTAVAVCRGVGLVLGSDADGHVTVLRVLDGSAADGCGNIRSGDLILEVDGQDVHSCSVGDIESRLIGPAGSSVTLLLEAVTRQRNGSDLSARPGPATTSVVLLRGEDEGCTAVDEKRLDAKTTETISVAEAIYRELDDLRRRAAHSGSALADALARLEGARRVEALLRETTEKERAARAAETRAYEERCIGKEATIAALQEEVSALRKALAARESDLNHAMAASDKAAEAHSDQRAKLERELQDLVARLRTSNKESLEKDDVAAQLRRELEALQLRFDALERDSRVAAAAAEQQRDAALSRLRKQGEEAQQLNAALQAASEVEAALRAALLAAEIRSREEVVAVQGKCGEKDAEISVLKGALESARTAAAGFEKALHEMEARLAVSQRAESDARAALDACRREGGTAADRVQALEAEVARLSGLCSRREDALRDLEERIAQAALAETRLREELVGEKAELEARQSELAEARSVADDLRAALAAAEARASSAEAGLTECHSNCGEKDAIIRDLQVFLIFSLFVWARSLFELTNGCPVCENS